MKIGVIVDKKKLIFKWLNVEKRVIFSLQGLEHICLHSFSPLFENARIYQLEESRAISICKPLRQHVLDAINYLKIQASIVMSSICIG